MKYRKKPVVIEAFKFDPVGEMPKWAEDKILCVDICGEFVPVIDTLEGRMRVNVGDWVIQGIKGELYPCRDDIFQATYERVE
jgi:hypothetical protein